MKIKQAFDSIVEYLSEAVFVIFTPSQSAYPLVGLQPFEGEPFRGKAKELW